MKLYNKNIIKREMFSENDKMMSKLSLEILKFVLTGDV